MRIPSITNLMISMSLLVSSTAYAGEAKITWQDPQNYTDIASNYGSQSNFQKSLFKSLDATFNEQAARLPEGNILEVTVTNFDMAGVMRTGPNGGYQRVVQNSQFPQMTLSYQLTDATGSVIAKQQNVIFKNVDFYSLTNTISQSEQNVPFYYEGAMIVKWFDTTFKLSDGQL